jgi:5-methylcytosine-specific restriction endonuclease McrA
MITRVLYILFQIILGIIFLIAICASFVFLHTFVTLSLSKVLSKDTSAFFGFIITVSIFIYFNSIFEKYNRDKFSNITKIDLVQVIERKSYEPINYLHTRNLTYVNGNRITQLTNYNASDSYCINHNDIISNSFNPSHLCEEELLILVRYMKSNHIRMNKEIYRSYRTSNHWNNIRIKKYNLSGIVCSECGAVSKLEVHHLSYDNLGNEDIENDLIVLCRKCHEKQHRKVA